MKEIMVCLTAIFMAVGTMWYIYLVLANRIKPVLTAWIIISVTMTLGLVSYWLSPAPTFAGGIGNMTGAVSTDSIILAVVWKNRSFSFSSFQKKCLAMAGAILIIWGILRFIVGGEIAAAVSNILTQVVMVIGFTPLVERLWKTRADTEALFTWSMVCLGAICAMIPPIIGGDFLGFLYGARGAITAGLVSWLVFMIRYRWNQNPSGQEPEET